MDKPPEPGSKCTICKEGHIIEEDEVYFCSNCLWVFKRPKWNKEDEKYLCDVD